MRTEIIPRFTEETAGFWAGAQQGEVRVEKCLECGRLSQNQLRMDLARCPRN